MDLKIGTNTDSIIAAIKMALINYEDNNLFGIFNPEYQLTFTVLSEKDSAGKSNVDFFWRPSSLYVLNCETFSFTLLADENLKKIAGYIDDLANEIHKSVVIANEEDSKPIRKTYNYFSPDGIN